MKGIELLMEVEELDAVVSPSWQPGVAFTEMQARRDRSVEFSETLRDYSAAVADTADGRFLAANMTVEIEPMAFGTDAFAFASQVKKTEASHLAVLDPWAWDMPMLVAHDFVDSICVFNDALQLEGDATKINHGRPTTDTRFTGQHGVGRYAEHIFYHLLNCGLRIAPSAFSNSGETKNPPGFNRVYVACGQDFSPDSWWRNLSAGRSSVSNGPVLRVRANEQLPGHVFKAEAGSEVQLEVTCDLATRQKVEYLEIIKNGRTVESVRLDKWAAAGGHLPIITFKESGWLIVRAHAPTEPNFRCAWNAPFYVEIGEQRHVDAKSAKFFQDWVVERAKMIRKSAMPQQEKQLRIQQQKTAHDFWTALEAEASVR